MQPVVWVIHLYLYILHLFLRDYFSNLNFGTFNKLAKVSTKFWGSYYFGGDVFWRVEVTFRNWFEAFH